MSRSIVLALVLALFAPGCCHLLGGGDDEDYDPCEDKEVGEECSACPPDDDECVETQEIKVCDAEGVCGHAPAEQHSHH
ncbi:MAG: hypothetical protein HOV80_26740 [Polyangiaceae bacterium]|nr:hypothetical protein [Polyangiaceae bacterium]